MKKKYQLLSPYFFTLYQAGMLEEHKDFLRWAALYQTKLDRENQYRLFLQDILKRINFKKKADETVFDESAETAHAGK